MESYVFAVDERPLRIWDWELREKNLRFLRGVDPDYFVHVAEVNEGVLQQHKDHRAALATRLAYSHALETFMAFAAAAFQAPACPIGWLLQYRNDELRAVIQKVTHGQLDLVQLPGPPTWEGLAAALVQTIDATPDQRSAMASGFSTAWRRLARDFLDPAQEVEYNSVKHGLRVAPGGFVVKVGLETSYGQSPPEEEMATLGASEYGSSYFIVEKPVGGKVDFRPRKFARNWHPENLLHAIGLLAVSLGNVVSHLRARGGDDAPDLEFRWPDDPAAFTAPWAHHLGATTFNFDLVVDASHITATSREDVLRQIRDAQAARGDLRT